MAEKVVVVPHHGVTPKIHSSVFLAPGVIIIGDVTIGEDSSIWPHAVLRGDVFPIRIGARTNIQDLSIGHVTSGTWPLVVGDDVTVGHRVILHGCTIKDRCLIGMGSIVMDAVVIGEESVIGAGSLVTEKTVVGPRKLALGSPAKVKRDLTVEEIGLLKVSADHYVANAQSYL